ncbi:hydroxypyruvate isomerase [Thermosporothrix hazakensis]|jgi:hydroxypyruvate isomerase|uniref:Hydroxypyruvate isomerase n=2 Tax=Thermosporothrix TaxID=768650 RepID=A0A326UFE7_THEHA|nr:TIM barrel protein [Thermosporothrix hazakensis]PZW29333.1 hydroxypyruvate isomerase [Thermosporothrix hazakensis]BBH86262.1 hydroxypyruvate isomerase [Thermosporothrix sp. COM3]GCE45316.1 hydroxypyruvate isomerase [Thermosporothrix hazakensis]
MVQFDVNISILLKEVPFLERFRRAAELGFGAVELWWPGDEQADAVVRQVREHGLQVALMNFDAGDMAAGERGFLNDPAQQERFREHVPRALDLARALGCPRLNALVGNRLAGVGEEEQRTLVYENLVWAADRAARAGVEIVVESLNSFENPRYPLTTTADVLDLLDRVNRPNVRYQYDIYHMQRMEGNILATLRKHLARIGHIQVADSPGRHEPGTGELHYRHILEELERLDYRLFVGLEYNPRTTSEESFAWLPAEKKGSNSVSRLRLL